MIPDPNVLTSQSLVGRAVRLPLRLVPKRLLLPVLSGLNKGARWRVGSSSHGCWIGTYEARKVAFVARRISTGMTVYDVGANAGYYTLLLSRLVGPTGRVYAFEPLPANLVNLIDHVSLNHCSNTRIVSAAVSDQTGLAGFKIGVSNAVGQLSLSQETLMVPTVRMDDSIAVDHCAEPSVIKMDIEGAEAAALRGAASLLRGRKATWFIALHGAEAKRGCETVLRDFGYRLAALDGSPIKGRLDAWDGDEIIAEP